MGVIYNFCHPLLGQFHYCFTQRGELWDIYKVGHFMDSKKNKLYYFIQLELLHLKNLTEIFGEEQSPRYLRLLAAHTE